MKSLKSLSVKQLEKLRDLMEGKLHRLTQKENAASSLIDFTSYTMPEYQINWHHRLIADKLDALIKGDFNRLMIFCPPQHGKSELCTRRLAAYVLGKNPDLRVAVCAYAANLAQDFNRDIQRIIDSPEYAEIFPDTTLNTKNVVTTGSYKKNASEFEIVGKKGSLVATGIGGPLTGKRVDFGCVDDLYKGPADAWSVAGRRAVSDWWDSVFDDRLHNNSKVVLTYTPWHHEDKGHELLKAFPDKWEVLRIPAINETGPTEWGDPREIGQALWPERHSLERLLDKKTLNPYKFQALNQCDPTPREGNIVKTHWFSRYYRHELPGNIKVKIVVDPSEATTSEADPVGAMAYCKYKGDCYILDYHSFKVEIHEKVRELQSFVLRNDPQQRAKVEIEPKGGGITLIQTAKRESNLNADRFRLPKKYAKFTKLERLELHLAKIETGRVFIPHSAPWLEKWLEELTTYPAAKHDESIDCMSMMLINEYENTGFMSEISKR